MVSDPVGPGSGVVVAGVIIPIIAILAVLVIVVIVIKKKRR